MNTTKVFKFKGIFKVRSISKRTKEVLESWGYLVIISN